VVVVVVDPPGADVEVVVAAVDCAPALTTKRDGNAMPAVMAATSPHDRLYRHHLRPILAPDCVKESLAL
jgi:hypothetical protein